MAERRDLRTAINDAERYMQALRLADPADRSRLKVKAQEALARAEAIKNGTSEADPHSKREQIIILEGSKLNGSVFKPWTSTPNDEEFEMHADGTLFTDYHNIPLSSEQLEACVGWERPSDALSRIVLNTERASTPPQPTMVRSGKIDLVQDITSDCSLVASLCAGTARVDRGHKKILRSLIYPYDHSNGHPRFSPNGKYILRLFFNGCWRKVEIDDRLPASKTTRVLHVIDRAHPGLLWPALLEKAYLKVRGGYDFPGSNSATDLAVLTGWIPQQLFLHDEEIDSESLWNEVFAAFQEGLVLLTVGTGRLTTDEQKQSGLAAEHDYAILELKEYGGLKEVLIKNPWANGDVWNGASKSRPHPNHERSSSSIRGSNTDIDEMVPGSFWMKFDHVFDNFENLYMNWQPDIFRYKNECHFSWHTDHTSFHKLFVDNPQYSISVSEAGEVWLLLNRHFKTGDYTASNRGKNGYISLYLFVKDGNRVLGSEGAVIRGPYVDSSNTLLRFQADPGVCYTAVVASQGLQEGKHNFTISAFAHSTISWSEAVTPYPYKMSTRSSWTRATAGGNADSPKYLDNPQFTMRITVHQKIAFVLRIVGSISDTDQSMHVKLLILSSDGQRITRLRPWDAVAHSGDYCRGSTFLEATLPAGKYTVICSTFERGWLGQLALDFYTSEPDRPTLAALPSERSGRLSIVSEPITFAAEATHVRTLLMVTKSTKVVLIVRPVSTTSRSTSLLLKMTLERGRGPDSVCIATSANGQEAEFREVSSMVRVEDSSLQATPRGARLKEDELWLVLERLVQGADYGEAPAVEVELLSEEKVELGRWSTH